MLPLVSSWEFIPAVIHKAHLQMGSIDAVCGILHLLGVAASVAALCPLGRVSCEAWEAPLFADAPEAQVVFSTALAPAETEHPRRPPK